MLGPSKIKNLAVLGALHPKMAEVGDVVASLGESLGELDREALVDKEPHAPRRSGSTRSKTASAA